MTKAGQKIIDGLSYALRSAKHKAKADELLAQGDAASAAGRKAESRRLLRECRRHRLLQRQYGIENSPSQQQENE